MDHEPPVPIVRPAGPPQRPHVEVGFGNRAIRKAPRLDLGRVVRSSDRNSGYRFGDFDRFGQ